MKQIVLATALLAVASGASANALTDIIKGIPTDVNHTVENVTDTAKDAVKGTKRGVEHFFWNLTK